MKPRLLPLLLILSACNAAPDRRLDQPKREIEPTVSYVREEPYAACLAANDECGPDIATACCEGLFCSTELLAYGPGSCLSPQADGSFCVEDSQCAAGRCYNNVCADPSCREQGSECYDDVTSCCPGLFCFQDLGAYGVALCGPPQPAGAFCLEAAACASGSCVDSVCQ